MKYLLLILLFTTCSPKINLNKSKYKLAKTDASIFINETKKIMNILGINIRDSLQYDGTIQTIISDSLFGYYKDFGLFFPDSNLVGMINNNIESRVYAYPIINIATNIDSIIIEKKDTSIYQEIYARSVIIHELTHYLQKTYTYVGSKNRISNGKKFYYNLPDEKEAYAVQYYFMFKNLDSNRINMLSTFPLLKSKEELWELFIDFGEKLFFNNNPVYNRYEIQFQ